MESVGEWRTDWGREFHNRGAAREKALSPKVFSLEVCTVRERVEEDRRALGGLWGMRRSDR